MQHEIGRKAITEDLTFDQVLERLKRSNAVEAVAEFGSRARGGNTNASDFDLIIVLRDLPAEAFQMITYIEGTLTDIVPVQSELLAKIVSEKATTGMSFFTRLLVQKLRIARILFDRGSMLSQAQAFAKLVRDEVVLPPKVSYGKLHNQAFWQGFVRIQAQRLAQSSNELRQLAADMMLTSILTPTYRAYFELRRMAWEGEKAALRYWQQYDTACYEIVKSLIGGSDINLRLKAYEQLADHVLAGYGKPIREGQTAAVFDESIDAATAAKMLDYWDGIFLGRT